MRIAINERAGGGTILAGAQPGRRLFAALVEAMPEGREAGPVFLDFNEVMVATSSFLRESVIAYRDFTRVTLPNLYPVIANANETVLEELSFFLGHRGDAMWSCELDNDEFITNIRVIGKLDEVQWTTLKKVMSLGSASAPKLATLDQTSSIGSTAWNNRLQGLSDRGLLMDRRVGKAREFYPVLGDR